MSATPGPLVPELPDRPGETVNIDGDRRASAVVLGDALKARLLSIVDLADVLDLEFGQLRPGETAVRGAIRVMREQRDKIAELEAALKNSESLRDAALVRLGQMRSQVGGKS